MAQRLEAETLARPPVAQRQVQLPPARLGHLAPALLGLPDPDHPLRGLRVVPVPVADLPVELPEDVSLRPARQPARPPPDLARRAVPAPAARRRGARRTRWTPSSIRPGTSRASPIRGSPTSPPIREAVDGGCRSTSISAASSTRSCTCSTPASSPGRWRRPAMAGLVGALRRPVHAGHGRPRDLQGRGRRLGAAGRGADRGDGRRAPGVPHDDRRRRCRSARSRRCRSRRGTSSIPTRSSRSFGADTARWFMLSDSPPERDVIWTEEGVQGAARFVQRVWRLVTNRRRRAPVGTRRRRVGDAAGCARPRTRRSRPFGDDIEACASTAASPTSTRWPTPSTTAFDARRVDLASPSARPPTCWCSSSRR